jgi:hypothetical protein
MGSILVCPRRSPESILTEYLGQQGGEVNRSSRLVGLTPYSEGVLTEIERDGERYQVDAR